MRLSQYPINTVKETPSEAEVISHQLMLRAGMIRRVAAGIYSWLPLGLRALRKVEGIVREEMNRAGAFELLHPGVRTPGEELPAGAAVGAAGVAVADGDGEEFQEAALGLVAGGGDQRWYDRRGLRSSDKFGWRDQGRGLRAHPRGRMMLPGGTQASRCSR